MVPAREMEMGNEKIHSFPDGNGQNGGGMRMGEKQRDGNWIEHLIGLGSEGMLVWRVIILNGGTPRWFFFCAQENTPWEIK